MDRVDSSSVLVHLVLEVSGILNDLARLHFLGPFGEDDREELAYLLGQADRDQHEVGLTHFVEVGLHLDLAGGKDSEGE